MLKPTESEKLIGNILYANGNRIKTWYEYFENILYALWNFGRKSRPYKYIRYTVCFPMLLLYVWSNEWERTTTYI